MMTATLSLLSVIPLALRRRIRTCSNVTSGRRKCNSRDMKFVADPPDTDRRATNTVGERVDARAGYQCEARQPLAGL